MCGCSVSSYDHMPSSTLNMCLSGKRKVICTQCLQTEHDVTMKTTGSARQRNTNKGQGPKVSQKQQRTTMQQRWSAEQKEQWALRLQELNCRACGCSVSSYDHLSSSTLNMCLSGKRQIICTQCLQTEHDVKKRRKTWATCVCQSFRFEVCLVLLWGRKAERCLCACTACMPKYLHMDRRMNQKEPIKTDTSEQVCLWHLTLCPTKGHQAGTQTDPKGQLPKHVCNCTPAH